MSPASETAVEPGIFELTGSPGTWIWAFTCPTPGCDCRTAILATSDGREALVARGSPVRAAWLGGEGYAKATRGLEGVHAFALDIDEGTAMPAWSDDPCEALDLDAHRAIRDVVQHIDGDVLEAVGHLWYQGKGWADPDEKSDERRVIQVESWSPGETVAWGEAFEGVRQDFYRVDERVFEAVEHYCVKAGCDCPDVWVDFPPVHPRGTPAPGAVRVNRSGTTTFEPSQQMNRGLLERLWEAFRRRHPRYVDRFARRVTTMHALADKVVPARAHAGIKVGRNDPCRCGSGKKYKKRCGAT